MSDVRFYIGAQFGSLRLKGKVRDRVGGSPNTRKRWRVTCVCGKELTVPEMYLIRPKPKLSCGCLRKTEKTIHNNEYRIWTMMMQRTTNPKHVSYKDYGGRGIRVCEEWASPIDGFQKFFAFIGPRPSMQHTVERINNDQGYQPYFEGKVQVKWATAAEQAQNKRPRKQ